MSRYYFHIRHKGGALVPDDEGVELKDVQAARAEMLASAQDIAMEEMRGGRSVGSQIIEIEDEDGLILESMPIRATLH